MSAADKGTGKEQTITIKSSGGLSDDAIQQMLRDAEANAEADKTRKELVDIRNNADSLVHSTDETLREHKVIRLC